MKLKLLNAGLLVSSLIGYLEWGQGNSMFLFQGELLVLSRLYSDPVSVAHPFTLMPLLGQILLVITLFQRRPGKVITLTAIACIGVLVVLMLVVGLISMNIRIILSTLPFIVLAIYTAREQFRK